MDRTIWRVIFILVPLITTSYDAYASCGSSFCVLNTSWDMQSGGGSAGSARIDLRYEYINQDQLREGTKNISAAENTDEIVEHSTVNRNSVVTMDYAFNSQWGISAAVPYVSRTHSHTDTTTLPETDESWDFAALSDTRVLGHYHYKTTLESPIAYGVEFGLKLPTGSHTLDNAEGTIAERALQPGTGTTDVILGGYVSSHTLHEGLTWFAHGLLQITTGEKDHFKPGNRISVTGGLRYPFAEGLAGLFQASALIKQRDAGDEAEPDLSGGRFLYASPGIGYSMNHDTQMYAFVQLPVIQNVNGIQLVAERSYVAGFSTRF